MDGRNHSSSCVIPPQALPSLFQTLFLFGWYVRLKALWFYRSCLPRNDDSSTPLRREVDIMSLSQSSMRFASFSPILPFSHTWQCCRSACPYANTELCFHSLFAHSSSPCLFGNRTVDVRRGMRAVRLILSQFMPWSLRDTGIPHTWLPRHLDHTLSVAFTFWPFPHSRLFPRVHAHTLKTIPKFH